MKFHDSKVPDRKGAILSMELVLVLPIFLLLIFSIVEFSMLMSAQTRVANADQNGARVLSVCGVAAPAAEAEVRARVEQLLGPKLAQGAHVKIEPGAFVSDLGHVRVEVPMGNACPDLLWMIGFSVSSRKITCDAGMVMERTASATNNDLH